MALSKKSTFKHGVHIHDMKSLSSSKAIEVMPAPERVYISLAQHIGKPAVAVVNVGDTVKKGQLIGKQDGFISANIYASVSGVVEEIKPILLPSGQKQTFIVIKNDNLEQEVSLPDIDINDGEAISKRIGEAGLVGLGGAGFPTIVKISPQNPVDVLLINGAECEPYLTCDHRIMLEKTDEFVTGAVYVKKALDAVSKKLDPNAKSVEIIIGIEENKRDAIDVLAKYEGITVIPLKKKYPQGSEKQLIYACTKRKVGCGKLPATTGVCVLNVQTVKQAYDAVSLNKPLYERVMTVTGLGVKEPKNLLVRNGTPYKDIIDFCGGLNDDARKIVAGGPMMGKVLPKLEGYTKKTDSGLLILAKGEANEKEPTNCISCGRCAKACPMHLMPMYIDMFTLAGDYELANKYGAMNCFECGTCAYVCPAKRDLVSSIQLCKQKLREMKK